MNSFIVPTTPPPPPPELICSGVLWRELIHGLRERGHHGERESGAFLLGQRANSQARILEFVLYDDLDPHSLDRGIVHFDGRYYGALWERCRRTGLIVVGDVHTHPFESQQSESDRAHPMIAAAGHIAVIIPRFAISAPRMEEIGMFRYLGARRWHTVPIRERPDFLQIDNGDIST
jgi:proteasome lid subunit RPN8/RPN11